jgi:transposase
MLEAIIAGQEDAAQLAQLARGRLKSKIPQLEQALAGRVRDHHRFLLAEYLDEWEALGERIRRIEAEIERQIRPFESAVALWQTIPGVDRVTACSLLAEIGVDMNQFPTAQHLASWAALCPGNHESAGKRKSGKTRWQQVIAPLAVPGCLGRHSQEGLLLVGSVQTLGRPAGSETGGDGRGPHYAGHRLPHA